jgi:hypothetical protein
MCLAFGWDFSWGPRGKHELDRRRIHLVADLLFDGFKGYNPAENADNTQYYPLNNIQLPNSLAENFIPILKYPGLMIRETRALDVRLRSPIYYGCPDKKTLYRHCERSSRFYPYFDEDRISGPNISFSKFLSWVERYDAARERDTAPFPKPVLLDGVWGNREWNPPNTSMSFRNLW